MGNLAKWLVGGVVLALASGGCSSSNENGAASGKYAMAVIVFGPDITTTYVTLLDSLDVTAVDTKKGLEFGGQANIASYDGHLFVSSGEAPTITRYAPQEDGTLKEEGTITFANLGATSVSVDASVNTFISPTKAYLLAPNGAQIVWNPTTLEITGQVEIPNMVRPGLDLAGSSGVARGNRLYRTFYWLNWSTYEFSQEQYFATYDTERDTLLSVVSETRCPNLGALAASDEEGTAYFSNWFYNVPGTLQNGKQKSCVLRLPPNTDALDPNWSLDFSSITGGHEGAQLSYIRDRKAVFAAYHEEAISITPATTPYEIASSPNWEAWSVDLDSRATGPVSGIDRMGAQQTVFNIDGRTFLLAPNKGFDTTKAYEITPDGQSRLAFSIAGWSRGFVKIQ